jgi:uncharacterized protein YdhG (YjbR/CyaY superfamily)
MRPTVIGEHEDEVAQYMTTKSALQFPLNRPIPIPLIKKLVKEEIRMHEAGEDDSHARSKKTTATRR